MLSIAPDAGRRPSASSRVLGAALCASLAVHVCGLAALGKLRVGARAAESRAADRARAPAIATMPIVFIVDRMPAGPSTGGGGGGNRQTAPMRRAESRGHDAATLRIARRPAPASAPAAAERVLPGLLLEARPLASGERELVGLPAGGATGGSSTGPGSGGGVGTGTGTGIGPGRGPGFGPGAGGGTGGGVYRVGGGVSAPRLLERVAHKYTTDALERRIQGVVVLDVVVTAQGTPAQIQVRRSLDPGLDQEAMDAVSRWRFAPGRLHDRPVAVLVIVELAFTIR